MNHIITVALGNQTFEHGFRAAYRSHDGKQMFSTNRETWKQYMPVSEEEWWRVSPSENDRLAVSADFKYLGLAPAHGTGAEPIWGDIASKAYLYHVVNANDMSEVQDFNYLGVERRGPGVAGTLYYSADDHFDLVVNGVPVTGGGTSLGIKEVELQQGDVICVRVVNSQYDKGFVCVFDAPDKRIRFGTNSATWGYYTPQHLDLWWQFDPLQSTPNSGLIPKWYIGLSQRKELLEGARTPIETLWVPKKGDTGTIHLFHIITESDLQTVELQTPGAR